MADLERIAGRAVEVALGAGAGDAEAFVEDSTGLEVRIFEQQVESLTEAGERGLGVRVWIDGRAGYPFYFGGDKFRYELAYKGQGRLIFAGKEGGTGGNLIWVIHNANDSGYRE